MFTIVCTGINMYIHGIDLYIPLCEILSIWSGFQMRGRVSEKQPSEVRAGPPLGAKASRSKIICVPHGTPRHLYREHGLKQPLLPRSAADQPQLICG